MKICFVAIAAICFFAAVKAGGSSCEVETTAAPDSPCMKSFDTGFICPSTTDMQEIFKKYYYYDGLKDECVTLYGFNCGGNGNRFNSAADCYKTCHKRRPSSVRCF